MELTLWEDDRVVVVVVVVEAAAAAMSAVLMNWNELSSRPMSQMKSKTPVVLALVNQLCLELSSSSRTRHNRT